MNPQNKQPPRLATPFPGSRIRSPILRRGACAGALLVACAAAAAPAGAQIRSARLAVIDASPVVRAGASASAVVEVTNAGPASWPAGGPIRLAYHVRDTRGRVIVFDGERTTLPEALPPGHSARICARVTAPEVTGPIVVEWDLVHEGVTWLSQVSPGATASHPVTVVPARAPASMQARVLAIAWLLLTLGHTVLCAAWGVRWQRAGAAMTVDQAAFATVVVWLGMLAAVLHVVAATVGLSLWSVGAGLVAGHLLLHKSVARHEPSLPPDRWNVDDRSDRWLSWAGLAVLLAIAAGWIAGDVRSPVIGGTDAAHYHVPHAVNLALGARLFDPPATGHLYPMGTSVLAAWLIVPTGSGLLADSATLPSFLLLAASLGWLFRQMTGMPGLSVVPWFLLAMLTLPIVRISAAMSADLPFAAAFIALLAQVVATVRGDRSAAAAALTGLLAGLLLGTKATGAPATVLLLGLLAAGLGAERLMGRRARTRPRAALRSAALGLALALAAGGLWQVRNWLNYGSPIAPVGVHAAGRTILPGQRYDDMRLHLSVLRDLREHGGQRTWRTARRHMRNWAGPWLPGVAWLLPLLVLDAAIAVRGIAPAMARARLVFVALAVAANGALGWLLISAPWTSLVWTNGLSLRYVLPAIILGAFLAPLAAFPASLPWYSSPRARTAGTLTLAAAAIAIVAVVAPPPEKDYGRHLLAMTPWSVAVGVALAAGLALAARWRLSRASLGGILAAATILASVLGGSALAGRATAVTADAAAGYRVLEPCPGATSDRRPDHAAASLVVRHDRLRAHAHSRRRVFVAARFDTPLQLQGGKFDTLVVDSRDVALIDRRLGTRGPGAESCDYIIASIAELDTQRGVPIVARASARSPLVHVGDAGPYRVWHVTPLGTSR